MTPWADRNTAGGFAKFSQRDSGLGQLRGGSIQDTGYEGGGCTKFGGDFGHGMRSLTAQADVQPDHFFLPWSEPSQDLGQALQIRPHVHETTPDIVSTQVQNSLALQSLLTHEW